MSRAVVSHAVRRGIPVALDIRDLWPDVIWDTVVGSSGGALRKSALATLRRSAVWAVRNATAVIGLTDEYVEWALELGGRPRSELDVAIPVTYPEYEPISDGHRTRALAFWRVQGLDLDRHAVVCFLGTLGRQFDFEPVIRAAGLLAPRYPDLRFVLCGQGEGLEVARERSRGLANVLWPGWVDGSARHLLLEHAVAGLAPYRPSENFRRNLPNKPVEYFANGIPVLYPIEGVLDRLCREHGCGVRYDPEREGHLADVVAGMLDDPQGLLAASRRASAVFQARFRAESVTDALLDHARAMSAAGRGGRRSGVA
jgi:glycosyltransferase involved in cell wall biosynthesis